MPPPGLAEPVIESAAQPHASAAAQIQLNDALREAVERKEPWWSVDDAAEPGDSQQAASQSASRADHLHCAPAAAAAPSIFARDLNRPGAPVLSIGLPQVQGPISAELVRGLLVQSSAWWTRCHARALRTRPSLSGELLIGFEIRPDGSLLSVWHGPTELNDTSMVACVLLALARTCFPPPGAATTVLVPFGFFVHEDELSLGAPVRDAAAGASFDAGVGLTDGGVRDPGADVGVDTWR